MGSEEVRIQRLRWKSPWLQLGIPFVVSALLIDRLKGAFDFVKKNYRVINYVCGVMLIAVGILMMTGLLDRVLVSLS